MIVALKVLVQVETAVMRVKAHPKLPSAETSRMPVVKAIQEVVSNGGMADETASSDPARTPDVRSTLYRKEYGFGALVLAAWFVLFTGGMLIDTSPYRSRLADPANLLDGLRSWSIVLSFWTITNIGFLCCLSALLGAFAVRTKRLAMPAAESALPGLRSSREIYTYYWSALLRGFGLFIFTFAGLIVFATESMATPSQSEYMRLSAATSVASFYAGFDHHVFDGLLARAKHFFERAPAGPASGGPPDR